MKIEKFTEKRLTPSREEFAYKINEIIDELAELNNRLDAHKDGMSLLLDLRIGLHTLERNLKVLDERLSDLEQCPINDARQCQPHKPEDDPDDVTFNKSEQIHQRLETLENNYMMKEYEEKIIESILPLYCKPGTFEWALIHMKSKKAVFRGKKHYGRYFMRCENSLSFQMDGCDTEQWDPTAEQILATDWQVI